MDTVQLKDKTAQTTLNDTDKFYLQQVSGDTVKYAAWSVMRAAAIAGVSTATAKTSNYDITDTDGIRRVEVDTTGGDVTIKMPLIANNTGRRIEIAHVKQGSTYKVIVAPHATDSTKLTNDDLAAIWLPKVGNYIVLQHSSTSGFWEAVDEGISSQLRLDTYAGYGGTDTKIMRFTNSRESFGNMFSENHSSGYASNADGLEITINRSGQYCFSYSSMSASGTPANIGLSLNSAQLTTNIQSINVDTRLILNNVPANQHLSVAWSGRLKKGDVVRAHAEGVAPNIAADNHFTASYFGQ